MGIVRQVLVADEANRQVEQGMNRLTLDVERRHAGGGANSNLLCGVSGDVIEQR